MTDKHFVRINPHPKAALKLGSFDVPCSILAYDEISAHVRVLSAGGIAEHLTFVRNGEMRRARLANRKQGPLGLDLWLDLQGARDAQAA